MSFYLYIIYQIWMDNPIEGYNNKNILGTFKKCITTHNVPTILQTDNETKFENGIMNQFSLK